MNRSRAELAAHLMKAARGAGLPLALAEDLYLLAGFVRAEGVEWIANDIRTGGAGLMDVTAALDRAACGETVDVSGEVARAMAAARGWTLKDGRKTDGPAAIASGPLDIDDAIWGELDAFAVRTYVPESAQSRDRGAGAGAIDND